MSNGDGSLADPLGLNEAQCVSATFRISADADPLMVVRIASQLDLSNRVPMHFSMKSEPDGTVVVESMLEAVSARQVDLIHRRIMQLTRVIQVEVDVS